MSTPRVLLRYVRAVCVSFVVLVALLVPQLAFAQTNTDGKAASGCIEASNLSSASDIVASSEDLCFWFYLDINGATATAATVASSNTKVVTVDPNYTPVTVSDGWASMYIYCDIHAPGTATVTVTCGADKVAIPVVIYSPYAKVTSAKKASYDKLKIEWQVQRGVSGYRVMRHRLKQDGGWATDKPETVAHVTGASTTSITAKTAWDIPYDYYVLPYVTRGGKKHMAGDWDYDTSLSRRATLSHPRVSVSVAQSGATALKLAWSGDAGATTYEILRSTKENSGYKRVGTTTAKTYLDKKLSKGGVYYYIVRASYPGCGAADSGSFMQYVKKKQSAKAAKVKNVNLDRAVKQYAFNWVEPDAVAYYSKGSKVYAVSYLGTKLKVYGFNSRMKKVSAKTVKLPKHNTYGGSFHGPDGNNYVALGYSNDKESDKKVVYRVVKYSSKWKKGKSATIKGENTSYAIDAGTVSFTMKGSELYVFTCHEMYRSSDGLRHQSNFAFTVNAKTMKAKTDNVVYTSHSFNQFARFKDDQLVLVDHGDGYPRAVSVCIQRKRGTAYADKERYEPFEFKGGIGANYTGATVGGVEVGHAYVLTCGAAQPHYFKVAGVKGFKNYRENLYVTITDRTTGKSKVKWLTKINPKTGKKFVADVRMVKLSDDRFVILYNVVSTKSGKATLHCDVVDNTGRKVVSKTYTKLAFSGSSQPVVHKSAIYWVESTGAKTARLYRIPAL